MPAASLQESAAQTNGTTPPATLATTTSTTPSAAPSAEQAEAQGPFSLDQVRAWAEGKQQPPPAAAREDEQPFSVDQVKQWAQRGTGLLETSPVLTKPDLWGQILLKFAVPGGSILGDLEQTNLGRMLVGHALHSESEMIAGLPRMGAAAIGAFTDKTVPEVQAERADLQKRLDDVNKAFNAASDGGAFNGEQAATLAHVAGVIEDQLKAADAYVASGGQSVAPARSVEKGLSSLSDLIEKGGTLAQADVGEVPVQTQASPAGQVASTVGEVAPQLAIGLAGGQIGGIVGYSVQLSAFAAQTFESQHQEAIEHGANERTANLAGLIGLAGLPGQIVAAEVPRVVLSQAIGKMLANTSVREGLTNLARVVTSAVSGGAGMASYQFAQNVAAHVAGYDPKRPLDAGVWQQAAAGAILDSAVTAGGLIGARALRGRAEVEVRARPGAEEPIPPPLPPEAGGPPAPGAPPVPVELPPSAPGAPLAEQLPEEQVQHAPQAPEQALGGLSADLESALKEVAPQEDAALRAEAARFGITTPPEAAAAPGETAPAPGQPVPRGPQAPVAAPEPEAAAAQPESERAAVTAPAPVAAPPESRQPGEAREPSAETPAYEPPTPYERFGPPARPGADASPEELARWNTWNSMVATEQAALQGARIDSPQVAQFNARAQDLATRYREQGRMVETPAGPMPEEWVSPRAVRPTGPAPEDPSIIGRILSAYREISAERGRFSVPIADVIGRAGVPLEEGRAAIAAHPGMQLDQGDWSTASLAQRQAAIRTHGRERVYMGYEPPIVTAAGPAPGPAQAQVDPTGARILSAYDALRAQGQPDSVAISDLQSQSGLPLEVVQAWLGRNRDNIGLHEGDWANASTDNRTAALNVNGRKNLLVDLSDLSRNRGAASQELARLPGPRGGEVRLPSEPVSQLSQRDAKRIVNASAAQSGLDGKVSYAPNEQSLPKRIKAALVRGGYAPGAAQTVWDRTLRQLWVIGDAFTNAGELHRALIEETLPRAFDGLRFQVRTVHDENDPRLGWWDPASEQATLNTAALTDRPQPLVDASKTAVHEAVVHGGFSQLFANTLQGRAAYVAAMREVRQYFDSSGISQELARARGFSGLEDMTQAYAREYGRTGPRLTHLVTEELLAAFAEERFPTRTSLERSPAWYQSVLGELGSEIRQAFGWRVNDWDVQQLIRDSYAAIRQGKEPVGVGAIPVHSVAIRPDEQAMAVLDVHPTNDYAQANIGQLALGRPLSEDEADQLHALLEGSGHPVGIINYPDGPLFVNYGPERLSNHDFQDLTAAAAEKVLGPGHTIELAHNEGTYASGNASTIARSDQISASRSTLAPGGRPVEYGRRIPPPTARAPSAAETGQRERPVLGPGQELNRPGRDLVPPARSVQELPPGEATAGYQPIAASGGTEGFATVGAAAYREELGSAPERDTYERSSLGVAGRGPEPRAEYERGAGNVGGPGFEAGTAAGQGTAAARFEPRSDSIGELFARASLRGGGDTGGPDRPAEEAPFRTGWSAKTVEAMTGEKLPYAPRTLKQAINEATERFRGLGNDIYAGQRWMEQHPEVYGTDQGAAMRLVISREFDRQIQDLRDRNFAQAAVDLTHSKELWLRDEAARETSLGQALNSQKLLYADGNSAVARWQAQIAENQRANEKVGGSKDVNAAYKRLSDAQKAAVDQLLAQAEPTLKRAQQQIDQSLEERYRNATTEAINDAFARLGFTSPDERPMLQKLYQSWESTIRQMVTERAGELPPRPPRIKISAGETIRNAISNVPLFERAWTEAVEKLKFDNPNALFFQKLESALDAPFSQAQLRGFMREQGINLRELVGQHYGEIGRTGQALYQKLVEGAGLNEEQALKIQAAFDKYFGSAVTAERERQVQEILQRAAPDAPKALPQSEVARILKLMNLGLFDKDEYHNTVAQMLGLESWDRQKLQEMKNAGNMVQQLLAEAGPRDLVNKWMARMTDLMLDQAPTMRKGARDAQSLWMASLLTGPFTHASYYGQNLLNNIFDLAFNTVGQKDFRITEVPALLSTYARSLISSAARDLPYSLATGTPMHVGAGVETPLGRLPRQLPFRSRLEAAGPGAKWYEGPLQFKGALAVLNAYNAYKYVGRMLSGMETVFRNGARDSVSYALGVRLGERLEYTPERSQELGRTLVYGTNEMRTTATQQAATEAARWGLTPLEQARRVEELIDDQVRDKYPELADQAERYAQLAIYRNSPYGVMGKVTAFLNELKRDHPVFGSLFSPFVTLPGNVINDMVNYSPIGFWRAGFELGGHQFGGPQSLFKDVPGFKWDELSLQEKEDIKRMFMGKAYTGMALLGAGGAYVLSQLANPNPRFNIHGEGPGDPEEKKQWRASGALPYSFKVGDRYYSYLNTPLRFPLALIGQFGDFMRYDKGTSQNWVVDLLKAEAWAGVGSVMHDNFLQGMTTLLTLLSAPEGHESQQSLQNFAATVASSAAMVPFGGTGTRQIFRFFNPTVYQGKGLIGEAARSIPIANQFLFGLRPQLNVLGEEIASNPVARLDIPLVGGQAQSQDPVWRYIVDNNIRLSYPTSASVNGHKLDPDEFYDFIKLRGETLKPLLAREIEDPEFRGLDDEDRDRIVKELENDATLQAKAQLNLKGAGQ